MCVKNSTYNGCDNEVLYTTWVVEHVELPIGKTNTPPRKEFPLSPIKKIATLVLNINFRRYVFTPCLPLNTKALRMS